MSVDESYNIGNRPLYLEEVTSPILSTTPIEEMELIESVPLFAKTNLDQSDPLSESGSTDPHIVQKSLGVTNEPELEEQINTDNADMESIFQLLNNINLRFDKLEQNNRNLKSKLKQNNLRLKHELKTLKTELTSELDSKLEQNKTDLWLELKNDIKSEINEISTNLKSELKNEIKLNNLDLIPEFDLKLNQIKLEIMSDLKKEFKNELILEFKNINVEEKIKSIKSEIKTNLLTELKSSIELTVNDSKKEQEEHIHALASKTIQLINGFETVAEKCKSNSINIIECNQKIGNQDEKLKVFENKIKEVSPAKIDEIMIKKINETNEINKTNTENTNNFQSFNHPAWNEKPRFTGTGIAAPLFIEELEEFYTLSRVTNEKSKIQTFACCLDRKAKSWWNLTPKENLVTWEEVKKKFLNQFFSEFERHRFKQEWKAMDYRAGRDVEAFIQKGLQLQNIIHKERSVEKKCEKIILKLPNYLRKWMINKKFNSYDECLINTKETMRKMDFNPQINKSYRDYTQNRANSFENETEISEPIEPTPVTYNYKEVRPDNYLPRQNSYENQYNKKTNLRNTTPRMHNFENENISRQNFRNKNKTETDNKTSREYGYNHTRQTNRKDIANMQKERYWYPHEGDNFTAERNDSDTNYVSPVRKSEEDELGKT